MNDKIDFVILWVDNNDKEWQKEKRIYEKQIKTLENLDNREIRYRDWDILHFWFRGVEKFAPWVNKIHFVTCGHLPKWLNTEHPKLHIVKHSDYMPKEALPTYNSSAIELSIHKIDGISDKFVLFNDDMIIINKIKEQDFFKNGLPCNPMSLQPIIPFDNHNFNKLIYNDVELINRNFNYKKSVKKNIFKYMSLKQGKYVFKTYPLLIYNAFPGFANFHMANAYLKSTFEEVWNKERDILEKTLYSRFRDNEHNVNQWLFNYWQFAKGTFKQKNHKFGKCIYLDNPDFQKIIEKQRCKIINLYDTEDVIDFEETKNKLIESFEKILPEKSSFEK